MQSRWLNTILLLFVFFFGYGYASASSSDDSCEPNEIYLELRVQNLLRFDLDGYICGERLYLPVHYMLTVLKIRSEELRNGGGLTADWPAGRGTIFRFNEGVIRGNGGTQQLTGQDMFYSDSYDDWMVEKEILEEVLEIELDFRYQELRVILRSPDDLPVVIEYNRVRGYRALGETEVVLTPYRDYKPGRKLLSGFAADWVLNSTVSQNFDNHSLGMSVGGNILGGDMLVSGRVSSQYGVNSDALRAFWRFPFYNTSYISQVTAGNASQNNLYRRGSLQYTGVEVTNRPLYSRYYFDNFNLSGELDPGWDVEFYSGERMIEVVRGLEGAEYHFQEPLHYGSNRFRLRYFSPMGFSHEEEFAIQIPQTLLPKGKMEYSLEAGRYRLYEDHFLRASSRMGINRYFTVGGGYQVTETPFNETYRASFASGTLRAGRLLVDAHHTFDYMTEANMRLFYHGFRSINLRFNYYHQSSPYQRSMIQYEGALNASFPLSFGRFRPSLSFQIQNTAYGLFENTSINSMLSANIPGGYNFQIRNRTAFRSFEYTGFDRVQNEYQVHVTKRLFRRYSLRPGFVYDQQRGQVSRMNLQMRSNVTRNANFSLFYEHDQMRGQNRFAFTFRYNFNFGNYNSRVHVNPGGNFSMNQSLRGTTFFDSSRGDFVFDRRYRMNSSVIRLEPFFVNDSNDVMADDYLKGQQLKATVYRRNTRYGARVEGNLIKNLIPYEEFIIKIDPQSFDNPLWQPESEIFHVITHPYGVNKLRVPIVVMGEAEGRVIIPDGLNPDLARGLRITLRRTDDKFEETIMTFSGGQFYYVGLLPGDYTATIDAEQLAGRSVSVVQEQIEFTVRATARGDIVDGIIFEAFLISD